MGKIDYKAIYEQNQDEWKALTRDPQKYEALLAGHYSDSNHFVYELLQNAEDAFDTKTGLDASKVVIEYYEDKLVFYHNGKPFDEADVRGVSSMLMGTKDRDDAQTIGRFGMGFKSVFKYTYQPEIYSDNEAFKITNYLLPVEITDEWHFEREKQSVLCKTSGNGKYKPFADEKHLTKIVIPFMKFDKDGNLQSIPGDDVLRKLEDLNGEILLFLTHIKELYWENKETGIYSRITLAQDPKDEHLITCRNDGTMYGEKENITRYLKYKKPFDHPDMENAEVSVAYKLNSRADNINEVENSPIWVYFPTRDETDLPFLIHGSFETAVSREKLMTPSAFNNALFDELASLIADSMVDLARRKLITQMFIRRSLMAAFEDEEENDTIPGLKDKITDTIRDKGLLPDRTGVYRKPDEMLVPVPFRTADFSDRPLIGTALEGKLFVAINNEREAKFTEYYSWLVDDLQMQVYGLCDLALDLEKFSGLEVNQAGEEYKALCDFYDFLSDYRESIYETGLSYSRSGPYEARLRRDLKDGWVLLRQEPIIINRRFALVPAEEERDKPSIYLGSSSEYKSVMQSALVLKEIADRFKDVLTDGFKIQDFNNFQYIKEKVIQKYIDIEDKIAFEDRDNYTKEYIEDINQILSLIEDTGSVSEIQEMLKDAWIIKTKPNAFGEDGGFARPQDCYAPISDEGIDLNKYYAPIPYPGMEEPDPNDEDSWYDFELFAIDKEYYESNGIAISKLSRLGLVTTPVSEGSRSNLRGVGDNYWVAVGEFCPEISIEGLQDNLNYIEGSPDNELAQEKSVEILKLLLSISGKLKGQRRRRQRNPYDGEVEEVRILGFLIKRTSWLFDKDMNVNMPKKMSRFELNPALYNGISANKEAYAILGFVEKEADETQETFQKAAGLTRKDKKLLINQLARELGLQVTEQQDDPVEWGEGEDEPVFDPNAWTDNEFPIHRINNIDYLIRHVQEQFYCADPVSYRKVLRQIRVSKNTMADRAYAIGMYTNAGNTKICQMCRKPIAHVEVDQIANFGIELPQLNLCLCRDCSASYKAMRDSNKDEFKRQIRAAFMQLDVNEDADEFSIKINDDSIIYFTQTHFAEIQEILRLLSEYGTPSSNTDDYNGMEATGPLMHPVMDEEKRERIRRHLVGAVSDNSKSEAIEGSSNDDIQETSQEILDEDAARAGSFVSYKKQNTSDIKEIMHLEPSKYPLHKAIEGHKAGDSIRFMTFIYEILAVMND